MFASKTLKTGVKKANEATPDAEYFFTNQNQIKTKCTTQFLDMTNLSNGLNLALWKVGLRFDRAKIGNEIAS